MLLFFSALKSVFLQRLRTLAVVLLALLLVSFLPTLWEISRVPGGGITFTPGAYFRGIFSYLTGLATGEFGQTRWRASALEVLPEYYLRSMSLFGLALTTGMVVGVCVGTLSALRGRKGRGGALLGGTFTFLSMPDFLVVLLLQLLAVEIDRTFGHVIPVAGTRYPLSWLLPWISLSLFPLAYTARMTHQAVEAQFGRDYVRTARSKGLAPVRELTHVLRNALPEVLAGFPGSAALTLSNLPIVEYLFLYHGITDYLVRYPTRAEFESAVFATLGLSLVLTFFALVILVDALRYTLDPRLMVKGDGHGG